MFQQQTLQKSELNLPWSKLKEMLHKKAANKKRNEKSKSIKLNFSFSLIVGRYAAILNCSRDFSKVIVLVKVEKKSSKFDRTLQLF